MLTKSLIRMKSLTLSLVAVIIIAGFAMSSVALSGHDYPIYVIYGSIERERPNIEIYLSTPLLPGGATTASALIGENITVNSIEKIYQASTLAGQKVFSQLDTDKWGELVACDANYTIVGGKNLGAPLIIYMPAYTTNNYLNFTIYTPDYVASTIITRALKNSNLETKDLLINLTYLQLLYKKYASMNTVHPIEIYPSTGPGEGPEPGKENMQNHTRINISFLVNNPITISDLYMNDINVEPYGAELAIVKIPGSPNPIGLAYLYRSIYIIIADDSSLHCLGADYTVDSTPNNGIVEGIVSPIVGWFLGIPSGSEGDVLVGSMRMHLYNPGINKPPYVNFLPPPESNVYIEYDWYSYDFKYHFLFDIIIPKSEIADLDRLLSAQNIDPRIGLLEALTYTQFAPVHLNSVPTNITITNKTALDQLGQVDRPILAPSLLFLDTIGRVNASEYAGSYLKVDYQEHSGTGVFGLPIVAYAKVFGLNPETVALAPSERLVSLISLFDGDITNIRSNIYEQNNIYKFNFINKYCNEIPILSSEQNGGTDSSQITLYLGRRSVSITNYYRVVIPCVGYVTLDRNVLSGIVGQRSSGMFSNPITALGLLSLIPSVLLVSWVMTGDTMEIIIGVARRWIAVASARGADLHRYRRRLILYLLLAGFALSLVGALLAGALLGSMRSLIAAGSVRDYISSRSTLILISVLLTVLAIFVVGYKKTRSMLNIKAIEAVRPVFSSMRISLPSPGRMNNLAIILFLLSLFIGLPRINPENLDPDRLGALAYILFIIIAVSTVLSPLAPLLGLSEASRFSTLLIARKGVSRYIVRLFLRGRRHLSWLAESSGEKIRDMLISGTRASSMGFGLALGAAVTGSALGGVFADKVYMMGIASANDIAALRTVSGMLLLVSGFGMLFTVLMVMMLVLSVFREIKKHVVILRARGASSRQALMFVYASFSPFIISTVLAGIITAFAFYLAVDSVVGIAFMTKVSPDTSIPHVPFSLSSTSIIYILVLIVLLWVIPLIVSYGVARSRDIARMLREGM